MHKHLAHSGFVVEALTQVQKGAPAKLLIGTICLFKVQWNVKNLIY